MNKKSLPIILLLMVPLSTYAHSGWIDRMIQSEVNSRALFFITLTVQALLSVFSFRVLKDSFFFRKTRVLCWRASKRWFLPLIFSVCLPFLLLASVGLMNDWLYVLAIIPDFIIGVAYLIWVTKLHFKKPSAIWKKLYVVTILTMQQLVGYVVFCLTYDTPIVKRLINNPDGWDRKDFWVYPEIGIITSQAQEYVILIFLLMAWHLLILAIQSIIKYHKRVH